jgi:hypothetical protein
MSVDPRASEVPSRAFRGAEGLLPVGVKVGVRVAAQLGKFPTLVGQITQRRTAAVTIWPDLARFLVQQAGHAACRLTS